MISATALMSLSCLAAIPCSWIVYRMVILIPVWLERQWSGVAREDGIRMVDRPVERGLATLIVLSLVCLFAMSAWRWGASTRTVTAMILTSMLVALALIDQRHGILPDVLTLSGIGLGLVVNAGAVWVPWSAAITGAIGGYVALWLFYQLYRWATSRQAMGYGDFKLFAMLGAWLGWAPLASILLIASLLAIVVGCWAMYRKAVSIHSSLPFGPYLVFGGILRLFEVI